MKARDLFGVIVRTIGLFLFLISAWYLVYAAADLFNAFPDHTSAPEGLAYLLSGGPGVFVAFLLLRFSRPIVRFCYPEGKEDSEE